MIILPDKHQPRGKLLMPMPRSMWIPPSLGQPKDQFGNENQTRWRVTGRCHDGAVRWRGWFDDREDADAFMWGIVTGEIIHDHDLWRQPDPHWYPDLDEDLLYAVDTVTFKSSPTNTVTSWTSPIDWDNAHNYIEVIGGGASGGAFVNAGPMCATGGGGGAYSKYNNFTFAVPGTTTANWYCGAGGAGRSDDSNGSNGAQTYFDTATTCKADYGRAGAYGTGNTNGGAGGSSSNGYPTSGGTRYSGGRGGNLTNLAAAAASGGGGAAGMNGAGEQGVDGSSSDGTGGGAGDAGYGGAPGSPPGNGTEWDGSHGSGGGSDSDKGADGSYATDDGGLYGGGSGGAASRNTGNADSGAGGQGLVVITYTPLSAPFFNAVGGGMMLAG